MLRTTLINFVEGLLPCVSKGHCVCTSFRKYVITISHFKCDLQIDDSTAGSSYHSHATERGWFGPKLRISGFRDDGKLQDGDGAQL